MNASAKKVSRQAKNPRGISQNPGGIFTKHWRTSQKTLKAQTEKTNTKDQQYHWHVRI